MKFLYFLQRITSATNFLQWNALCFSVKRIYLRISGIFLISLSFLNPITSLSEKRANEMFWFLNLNYDRHFKFSFWFPFLFLKKCNIECNMRVCMSCNIVLSKFACVHELKFKWMCQRYKKTLMYQKEYGQ